MRASEQTQEISTALAKAQGEMKNPEKNKTANIPTKAGGNYSYNYADLPSTFDAVRTALASNGLSHLFGLTIIGEATVCTCRLGHASGQWYESEIALPYTTDIKALAGNLTYLRRYLFSALVGIAGDDDVDGEPESGDSSYVNRSIMPPAPSGQESPVKPVTGNPLKPDGSPTTAMIPHPTHPSPAQIKFMFTLMNKFKIPEELLRHYVTTEFSVESTKDMTINQFNQVITAMERGLIK